VKAHFDISNRIGATRESWVWRTDRQTDRHSLSKCRA